MDIKWENNGQMTGVSKNILLQLTLANTFKEKTHKTCKTCKTTDGTDTN